MFCELKIVITKRQGEKKARQSQSTKGKIRERTVICSAIYRSVEKSYLSVKETLFKNLFLEKLNNRSDFNK